MEEVPHILPAGDRALSVTFGYTIDPDVNDRVQALADSLRNHPLRGVIECVPTYCSLLVCYDPMQVRYTALCRRLLARTKKNHVLQTTPSRILAIPCLYDGEDLPEMADLTGLPVNEIIRIHSQPDYRVYMLGFLPGFVYLGGLDARIAAPRLSTPRTVIPAGSVGIGGSQTGVYPMASPGGWRLIGRTPIPLYDPTRAEAILCRAGDRVRFVPIDPAQYDALAAQVARGEWQPTCLPEGGRNE